MEPNMKAEWNLEGIKMSDSRWIKAIDGVKILKGNDPMNNEMRAFLDPGWIQDMVEKLVVDRDMVVIAQFLRKVLQPWEYEAIEKILLKGRYIPSVDVPKT